MRTGISLCALTAGMLAAAGMAWAAVNPTPAAPSPTGQLAVECAHVACRTSIRPLGLRDRDGKVLDITTALVPYADENGTVALYAGEAIELSFADRNDLGHPQFVRVIDHVDLAGLKGTDPSDTAAPTGPATITLELKQDRGQPGMNFVIRNGTGVTLKYDAVMFVPTPDGVQTARTSMCPVFRGMMGNESWPHPIAMLLLSGFRKTDAAAFSCD